MLLDYNFRHYNFRLLLYILALNVIGVLVLHSATSPDMSKVEKQIMGIVVGVVIMLAVSLISYQRIASFSMAIYGVCAAALVAVLLWGRHVGGATRWIVLPVVGQVQPSEFAKIGLIVFFSWYLSKYQERINTVSNLGILAFFTAIPLILIMKEPNLSTTLVTAFTITCMIFVAGLSYRWIFGILAVLTPICALAIYLLQNEMMPFLHDYQVNRILAWVDRAKYADSNYQQDNSIMAIGSGLLSGKGLNNNTLASVKNGNFLSEEQTDFIFAIIGEELGFIGCVAVISLFAAIVYECLWMASHAKDLLGKLICTGTAALLAFQAFSNIAVATGVFPNTGLPLPFISYGVSSLLSMYVGVGLVLNVGLQRKISHY